MNNEKDELELEKVVNKVKEARENLYPYDTDTFHVYLRGVAEGLTLVKGDAFVQKMYTKLEYLRVLGARSF